MRYLVIVGFILLFLGCGNDEKIMKKQVKLVPVMELSPFASKSQDTVYVLNFWKSTNDESVKQLSLFEKLRIDYRNKKVRMISISLDKKDELKAVIAKIVKENNIKSEIILADQAESKKWIEKLSPFWSGNVPATFLIFKNQKDFYGYGLSYSELKSMVDIKLKNSN